MKHASLLHSTLGLIVVLLFGISLTSVAVAQTAPKINELFMFSCNINGCHNGGFPSGALVQASNGDFYATTFNTSASGIRQGGTIFRVTAAGQLTTLFTFAADQNGKFSDGSSPAAGLVEGRDGFLYGTTEFGGASNSGILFRVGKKAAAFRLCTTSALPQAAAMAGTQQLRYFREPRGTSMGPLARVELPRQAPFFASVLRVRSQPFTISTAPRRARSLRG